MGGEGDSNEPETVAHGDEGGEVVAVNVSCSNGSKFSVRTNLESTVESFKSLVEQDCNVPANQQRLIYKGRILKNDQTLLSYGLQENHTLHIVRGFLPSTAPPAANTVSQTTAPSVTRGVGSMENANTRGAIRGEPWYEGAGFNFVGGGNFGGVLPDIEQAHQQLAQNPTIARDMMNTPGVQNLMNNPELMRTMIMSNPQMRELVDRNPELGHVLNDPSIIRQSLEAARNPELMREMTRNTDRAMSNIEATPNGFNMLRRMYENVQEPLLNATMMSGDAGNNVDSDLFSALLGNQGAAQGREASNNPTTTNAVTGTGNNVPNTNPLPNPWEAARGRTTAHGRRNSGGDTRALGGFRFVVRDPTVGVTRDASQVNQLLQDPAMSQMMQNLRSNPQYMNQIMSLSPQLQTLIDSSPQVGEMMQNPEFLRLFSSPEAMQQMVALQQSLLSGNRNTTSPVSEQTGATTGTGNNEGMDLLMNMFGNLGTGGLSGRNQSNVTSVPPEERYATQIQQLEEMGFSDRAENILALQVTDGNVNAAIERLL